MCAANASRPAGNPVTLLGPEVQSGAYVLYMVAGRPLSLAFGRFQGGHPLPVPAGAYVYAGSAMAARGSATLARRLVRHACRTGSQPPHPILDDLLSAFADAAPAARDLLPRRGKGLFWHVDYLLDEPSVQLAAVLAVRTRARLEDRLAAHLERAPETFILARGLGAADAPGRTHLLGVRADCGWWPTFVDDVRQWFQEE